MELTVAQFTKIFPATKNAGVIVASLNKAFVKFGINTAARVTGFLAQAGHESGGFSIMIENLNYSATGLMATFPKKFTMVTAARCARQPQKIANIIYANRMGNGNDVSNDGYTYRGRGFIQLTGKSNYVSFATALDMSVTNAIKYLETVDGAAMSAAWFWSVNGLNALADQHDIIGMTRKINGGVIGIVGRQDLYNNAKGVIV